VVFATLLIASEKNGRRRIRPVAIGNDGAVAKQLRTLFNLGTIRELSDGQLLERFATAGGEAAELAFAALVERHGPMVMRVCRSVLAEPHDTQGAFRATFFVLVKKARGLSVPRLVPGSAASLARGILSSMYVAKWMQAASVLLLVGATTSGVGYLAQNEARVAKSRPPGLFQAAPADDVLATTVKSGKLSVTVVERGNLEADKRVDAYSSIEGRTTIIQILPEGSAVKQGQVVCRLDSTSLMDQLVNQKITEKSAEAIHENARIARQAAALAVTQYVEGLYKQELGTVKNAIIAAQSAIKKADARLDRTRLAGKRLQDVLAAKGSARSASDIVAEREIEDRLEAAELTRERQRMALDQATFKQELLEKVTPGRTTKELTDEVERKRSAERANTATLELEHSKVRKLERQIANCTIIASADGSLVYASDPAFSGSSNRPQIEEGATVRERQRIFSIIELNGPMNVNTKVRESQVDKLQIKMKARIRVDALADEIFDGTVIEIAPLPDPGSFFQSKRVYTTKVRMDRPPPGLRPGMSAQVEIFISEHDHVLSVPIEAIVFFDGRDRVALKKPDGAIEWREVTLGQSNDKFVEVQQGIAAGDRVAVRPLDLMTGQQKRTMRFTPIRRATKGGGSQRGG
jgi:HlyD family secretion protein